MTFDEAVPAATARIGRDAPLDIDLPGGGRLQIDRPVPFLCVYRMPDDRPDSGTAELVTAEAAYLLAPGDEAHHEDVVKLARAIGETLYNRFGGFLFVEIWSSPDDDAPRPLHVARPGFRVIAAPGEAASQAVSSLRRSLAGISLERQKATVEVARQASPAPPGMQSLSPTADDERQTARHVCIEVAPVYRATGGASVYPMTLGSLRGQFAQALRRGLHDFATAQRATAVPEHYQGLGPRGLASTVQEVDRQLQQISGAFDFVLLITPTNADEAWARFEQHGFAREPVLRYRPLALHPDAVKRRLYAIRLERVRDPTLQHLMREKRDALDLMISMLTARGSRDFLYGSLRLYGTVDDELLGTAREVLDRTAGGPSGQTVWADAGEFRQRARAEVREYRAEAPLFAARVRRRNDIASGVMVSKGDLLVADALAVAAERVDPLIHHEVGTHLVTYYNGVAQPLRQLRDGLPGYEPLQEGLALLAEHLTGGLNRARLRQIAARVVAVRLLTDGAGFVDTVAALRSECGLGPHRAFSTAVRVHRSGGLTKDAAYLRGLADVLAYLGNGGDLEPLFVGKIALRHVPLVQELSRRAILHPPRIWPRYLRGSEARRRVEACRGQTLLDLCAEAS